MNSCGLSSSEIFNLQSDKVAFDNWNMNEPEYDYSFAKKVVIKAIDEVLTDRQKQLFVMYHIDGLTIRKIAEIEGVNSSTVSRVVLRATKKLYTVLRWSNPVLLNAPIPTRNRRNLYGN